MQDRRYERVPEEVTLRLQVSELGEQVDVLLHLGESLLDVLARKGLRADRLAEEPGFRGDFRGRWVSEVEVSEVHLRLWLVVASLRCLCRGWSQVSVAYGVRVASGATPKL